MEGEPEQQLLLFTTMLEQVLLAINVLQSVGLLIVVIGLVFLSGLISGSENAFFSLSLDDLNTIEDNPSRSSKQALKLLNVPDRAAATQNLLATILILNNFINISIIILSTYLLSDVWLSLQLADWMVVTLEIGVITFMLVLFGEIIPKIYATQNNLKLVHVTAPLLFYAQKVLTPFVWTLTKSTKLIDRKIARTQKAVSLEELNQAIEIASVDDNIEEKNILKGLVNYGNISVKQKKFLTKF